MLEARVAMQNRSVGLVLADGSRLEGEVFLSLYDAHRDGPQRFGDLLNGDGRFLPVRTAAETSLVNLACIVAARTLLADEADDLMRLGERHLVRIRTLLGEEITADLFVNMPQSQRRVKDYLNQPQRFLPLFLGEDIVYLNIDHIVSVRD